VIADAATRYREAAITRLITSGILTDPAWRDALRDLPRDQFVTDYYEPNHTGNICRGTSPETGMVTRGCRP
jgi:hypothetical protein